MDFYSYQYFINQSENALGLKYVVFIGLLILLLLIILKRFKAREKMKYRDLIILLSLLCVFFVGIQVNDYQIGKVDKGNSSQMVGFLKGVSKSQSFQPYELSVNSRYIKDEMLLRVGEDYYQVNLNADFSSFKLEETYLINTDNINIVEE